MENGEKMPSTEKATVVKDLSVKPGQDPKGGGQLTCQNNLKQIGVASH